MDFAVCLLGLNLLVSMSTLLRSPKSVFEPEKNDLLNGFGMTETGHQSRDKEEEVEGIFKIVSTYHTYMYPDTPFHRHRDLFDSERKSSGGELIPAQFNANFINGPHGKNLNDNEKSWLNEQIRMYNSRNFSLISPTIRKFKYRKVLSDAEMDRRELFLRRSERLAEKNDKKEL